MSDMASKMVLRAKIKSLSGKSAKSAYEFFSTRVATKPEDYDPQADELYYDKYEQKEGTFRPVRAHGKRVWGVEYLFEDKGSEYHPEHTVSIKELNRLLKMMEEVFGIEPDDAKIYSYTWYTGSDEPFDL